MLASRVQSGIHDKQLRSWVYKPCANLDEALAWAQDTLKTDKTADIGTYTKNLTSKRLQDVQSPGLADQPFLCRLVLDDTDAPTAVVFYGTHSVLDGLGALETFKYVLEWVTKDSNAAVEALKWGKEVENLPLGPVTATGGPLPGWHDDGEELVSTISSVLAKDPVRRVICTG